MDGSGHVNAGLGGATPHNEYVACAIVRSSGDGKTQTAMDSKTRSPHHPSSPPNYHYQDAGSGWGGNVNR
jgi:hypothetical protein